MTDRKIIVVTGCRDWTDRIVVEMYLSGDRFDYSEIFVFHGDCPTGADFYAKKWLEEIGDVSGREFVADWKKHGRAAGPIRNGEMLCAAKSLQDEDESEETELECLAFWDGQSRGTLDCISQATALGIPVRIVPRGGA